MKSLKCEACAYSDEHKNEQPCCSCVDNANFEQMLTDDEVIKALKCCAGEGDCDDSCPGNKVKCETEKYTLDLIYRLQAEKQDLEIKFNTMRGAATYYKTEVERLKQNLKEAHIDIKEQKETVKRLQGYIQSLHEEYLIF